MFRQLISAGLLITCTSGCTTTGSGSGFADANGLNQSVMRETRREYITECVSRHADQIFELSQIDPTYLMRYCRKEANDRLRTIVSPPPTPGLSST